MLFTFDNSINKTVSLLCLFVIPFLRGTQEDNTPPLLLSILQKLGPKLGPPHRPFYVSLYTAKTIFTFFKPSP